MLFLGKHLLVLLDSAVNGTVDAYGTVTQIFGPADLAERVNMTIFAPGSMLHGWSVPLVDDRGTALEKRATGYCGPIAYPPPAAA